MNSRADRANLFATGVLAVLARHRLKVRLGSIQIAFKISINAQPLHDAPDLHLLTADYGNIVLRIATHDAGIAANTTVQIDRHAPRILDLQRRGILLVILPRIGEERISMARRLTLRSISN